MNKNISRYQCDRFYQQKERFLQTFEAEQQSLIEYKQRLESERKLREQQDKEFQEALKRDQELEMKRKKEQEEIIKASKPLSKDELRSARLSFFNKVVSQSAIPTIDNQ